MSDHVICAEPRTIGTKGALNKLRHEGRLPAIMYDRHGKTTPLTLVAKDFAKAIVGVSESTIIKLSVGDGSYECLIKDRQLDWLRGQVVHVDFFKVENDVAIRVKVPVHLLGIAAGIREGGILENPMHEIEVECLPKDMPAKFDVDVSELKANHSIHVRDIPHADVVRFISSGDQVVALVKYAKSEPVAAEAAVTAATPAAGTAAGTAAAPGAPAAPGTAAPSASKA